VAKKSNDPKTQTTKEVVAAPPLVPAATSEEAIERHLAEWGGSPGRLFAFNGSTGIHRTLDDGIEVPGGTEFIALLHETQKGFIKFNGPGVPPSVRMVRIDQNIDPPSRESLGDTDESKWSIGLNGELADPWIEQYAVPLMRDDPGGELFVYVSRGVVAMLAFEGLLGRWRHHPRRQEGLDPVVKIDNGTYWSKRFNANRPKPILKIVRWVRKDGTSPAEPKPVSLAAEMNDAIPDLSKPEK
jgi:hypothetical protein